MRNKGVTLTWQGVWTVPAMTGFHFCHWTVIPVHFPLHHYLNGKVNCHSPAPAMYWICPRVGEEGSQNSGQLT